MKKVLIAAGSEKSLKKLDSLMSLYSDLLITRSSSGSQTRQIIDKTDPDLIIISSPLPDESGCELALSAAEKTNAGIMLICSRETFDETSSQADPYGVCVIPEPVNKTLFMHSVKLLGSIHTRMINLITKNGKLQTEIEETRLVSRAKCVLIQYLKLTESQAHKYIEKQAMDTRQSRSAVARSILTTYEQL